jgi:cell fate (sporulation/competence/biofilm development) regulator YlbF (YheA/YmcA/DUF963 family)
MDSCSNTCQWAAAPGEAEAPQVMEAAETLACLLTDTSEFQNFLRVSRAVRLDEEVDDILNQINAGAQSTADTRSTEELENRLELLPVVQEYRRAEQAARGIFAEVEQAICAAAGLPFAEYAKSCGGG